MASSYAKTYKITSALLAVMAALIGFMKNSYGEALVITNVAFFALLYDLDKSPEQLLKGMVDSIRAAFQSSDRLSRALLIVIAIGGTAMIVDYFYPFQIIPDFMDPVIKRSGIPLVIVTIVLGLTTFTSNLIRRLSEKQNDEIIRGYELCFYVSAILLIIFVVFFWLGFPFEDYWKSDKPIPSLDNSDGDAGTDSAIERIGFPAWPEGISTFLMIMSLISLVWFLGFLACIILRYVECYWTLKPEGSASGSSDRQRK
jgi:hypothetical protein